uniref:Uncharacterized protein n=1 Tax=Naja naja TaxID=35670 RepID=A0A8C6Y0F3_NAJNA
MGGPTVSGTRTAHSAFNIPNSSGLYGSQDSVSSTPEEGGRERATASGGAERPGERSGGPRLVIGSLPAHLSPHLFGATAAAPEGDESRSYPNCTSSTQKSATPSSCKDGDSPELGDPKTHNYSAVESYLLPQLSP